MAWFRWYFLSFISYDWEEAYEELWFPIVMFAVILPQLWAPYWIDPEFVDLLDLPIHEDEIGAAIPLVEALYDLFYEPFN